MSADDLLGDQFVKRRAAQLSKQGLSLTRTPGLKGGEGGPTHAIPGDALSSLYEKNTAVADAAVSGYAEEARRRAIKAGHPSVGPGPRRLS